MHLLLAQKGTISDGEEAIDLGQSPADILFLSAADTELSAIAAAHRARQGKSSLRVASLLTLKHPMSVDTYVERTARHAKLIIVRPLGGASYFQYVLEALHAAAVTHKFQIAVLPGCDKPDPGLEPFSTVSAEDRNRMWAYFTEGGADNMTRLLAYADALIDASEKPEPAAPLLKAGIWWPGEGVIGVEAWKTAVSFGVAAELPPSVSFADMFPLRGKIDLRQSGRSEADLEFAASELEKRERPPTISPLEGEMPDRAEGGKASAHTGEQRHAPIVA
ncbi:MAG: cobaltochelatase subunit CobN, partial [Pararhizobium sp.]